MDTTLTAQNLEMTGNERCRRAVRALLPSLLYVRLARMVDAGYGISALGVRRFLQLRAFAGNRSHSAGALEQLTLPTLRHPVHVRPGTSDFEEVLYSAVREAYAYHLPSQPVRVIVDAGAYIGDSTVWYLSRFAEARVIALEPDPNNFRVAELNCRPYGERVHLLQAAVWTESKALKLVPAQERVSVSVQESPETCDCHGIAMTDLMHSEGIGHIDILKLDVENAELLLFSSDCDPWLSRVRSIAMELHSAEGLQAVLTATRRHGFSHQIYRNLHFFHRTVDFAPDAATSEN